MFAIPARLSCAASETGMLRRFVKALAWHRQRKQLLALDDHMLCDIGLTADMVRAEAARHFWDAPDTWKE